MKYRVLGRTGLKVSELGFGGHEYRRWLPRKRDMEDFVRTQAERNALIEMAVNAGINYFDTTFPEEVESLGLALKAMGTREDVHVALMIQDLFGRMAKEPSSEWRRMILDDVEKRLKLLDTDYADILTLYAPEEHYSRERLAATLKVFRELKEIGKTSFIGASSHNLKFLAELMRRYDCFDTIMVRYNYYLQEARDVIFPLAKALEVGVIIMKPFAWPYYGIPFTRFGPVEGEEGTYTPAQLSLRWILKSPEVATVVPGMNSYSELEENLAAITIEDSISETVLEQYLKLALGPKAKERLRTMLRDPSLDIRHFAKRALIRLVR